MKEAVKKLCVTQPSWEKNYRLGYQSHTQPDIRTKQSRREEKRLTVQSHLYIYILCTEMYIYFGHATDRHVILMVDSR